LIEKPGDIRDLSLAEGQRNFVKRLRESSDAKIIVVSFGGRPRLLGDIVAKSDAILIAFLPGPDAGIAVVDLITGVTNPNAKLPITYPKYQDGGGVPYWHSVSDQCTGPNDTYEPLPHYAYNQCEVEWPFGYGLSYTTFKYSNLLIDSKKVLHVLRWSSNPSRGVKVSVKVKNTGDRSGSETIMFFIFDENRHVTPEYKRLIHFEKIKLDPGEERTVVYQLTTNSLWHVGPHDDTHDILQMGQKIRIGIGAETDCRRSGELCSDSISLEMGEQEIYNPVCETACNLLYMKGCHDNILPKACYATCLTSSSPVNVDEAGWGWNYVNCIESILLDDRRSDANKCQDVDSLCRKVLDKVASAEDYSSSVQSKYDYTTIVVSVLAGIVGTLIIISPFFKGACWQRRRNEGDIEFTAVNQNGVI